MNTIPDHEIRDQFNLLYGRLRNIRTVESRRRNHWGNADLHDIGDPFVRDFSVICSSKAYRRMSGKNQVATTRDNPHIRNRMTHVGEVMAISARLADFLGLNVNLTSAIAVGHDIGHVPFGHQGERWLQERTNLKITHEVLGVVIAQHVERSGHGLNLTWHTLDGMYRHSGVNANMEMSPEACVVRIADKVAYLFADYNDFHRMGWEVADELSEIMDWFGHNQRDRTLRTLLAICLESTQASRVVFETSEAAIKFAQLRKLMYREYEAVVEQSVGRYLEPIYGFLARSGKVPPWLGIGLLTDDDVHRIHHNSSLLCWRGIASTGLGEIVDRFGDREKLFAINPLDVGLDW